MKIISHRGNTAGRCIEKENSPEQIDIAISCGYDVEIDLRFINDELLLGHDFGQYKVNNEWLLDRKSVLWVHSKNMDSLLYLSKTDLNYFYHVSDDVVLTSKKNSWCYPGVYLKDGITVELEYKENLPTFLFGICTDFPELYKNKVKKYDICEDWLYEKYFKE